MNTDHVAYVANDTVLHHVSRWWGDTALFINGEPVPLEFPQALPPGYTITARAIEHVLDGYTDDTTSKAVTIAEHDAERDARLDHDGEFLSDEDELAWKIREKHLRANYRVETRDVPVTIVAFRTCITSEPYITCAPCYARIHDEQLEKGAYFAFQPDVIMMLVKAIEGLGMDMTKLSYNKERRDIKSATYDNKFILIDHDEPNCLRGCEGITLDEAIQRRDEAKNTILRVVKAFKARHDPHPLTNGEFYTIIEHAIQDFARCKVYAGSKDVAGRIQRQLKELMRRMEAS